MSGYFDHLGVMIDNSRNAVMTVESVKKMIDLLSKMSYNTLLLYTEDTYEVNNQPYFGHMRGRYSKAELKEMDAYARSKNIELMPCIQCLAHLGAIMRWGKYSAMRDCGDILCVGEEDVYELIEDMFATIEECFTSRTVNIGMDEAGMIGLGKYLEKNGYKNRSEILLSHLNRVSEIAAKHGFTICMWGDMFFKLAGKDLYDPNAAVSEDVKSKIPRNVRIIYWDYYSTSESHYDSLIKAYSKIKDDIWFAGGFWTWSGVTPNNLFSIHATESAMNACMKNGIRDIIFTMWGDNGGECSRFGVLPSLFYASERAKGITDIEEIKKRFLQCFHISFDDFMLIDLPDSVKDDSYSNPERYLLYNDCFMGLLDGTVSDHDAVGYKISSKKLKVLTDNPDWGWLFKTQKALCDVLAIKTDLGVRTRKAYLDQDKSAVLRILADYRSLIKRLNLFYESFEQQWMLENKPHGFDVQDIRLGGLIRRVEHCMKRLKMYVNGEVTVIPELEEPVLDIKGNGEELITKNPIRMQLWNIIATANTL